VVKQKGKTWLFNSSKILKNFILNFVEWSGDHNYAYLIFVISVTQATFLENRIYTEKRVNYDERISRQNSINQDLLGQATKKVCKPTY